MSTLTQSPVTPSDQADPAAPENRESSRRSVWAKRAGTGVFLFFLIKGLLWLAVPPLLILGARLFAE